MTAQPEVVWATWFGGDWHATLDPVHKDYKLDSVPYVSQASLTAALAERDEARHENFNCDCTINVLEAERDKLAKALERANTYLAEVGHCLSLAEAKRLAKAFLTAQAAQGETKQSVRKSADADTTVLNEQGVND